MNSRFWFGIAVTVAIGIFALSTFLAIPIQVEGVSGIDKWEHTFAYLVLAITSLVALKHSKRWSANTSYFILLACGLYGFSLELVQFYFFSYRFFEWLDALANVLGAVLGYLLFVLFNKNKRG